MPRNQFQLVMRHSRSRRWLAWCFVLFMGTAAPVSACIWDYDTLRMERQRFPTALELMTGKFLRHSPEYYHWRIADRQRRLALPENKSDPELLDDLAVAHHKLGNNKEAIRLMLDANARQPKRYETLANLGTFYMLDGQFEKGRGYIIEALEINPDAHFGRERYQKLLADYVLGRKQEVFGKLPLALQELATAAKTFKPYETKNFATFVLQSQPLTDASTSQDYSALRQRQEQELQAATKGVLGMMKFADYQSPVLLEVLGDLLTGQATSHNVDFDARQLAARAYLLASQRVEDQAARDAYRKLANYAMNAHRESPHLPHPKTIDGETDWAISIEGELKQEVAEANQWFENIQRDEKHWIETGADVDAEFSKRYYQEPELLLGDKVGPLKSSQIWGQRLQYLKMTLICTGLALGLGLLCWHFWPRNQMPPAAS